MPTEAIEFPVIDGYSAQWDIQPLDKIFVYAPEDNDSDLACYSADSTQHTQPVQVDRFGNMPDLYIDTGEDVTIALCNRYGVERYRASRISGTWYKTINYIFSMYSHSKYLRHITAFFIYVNTFSCYFSSKFIYKLKKL